MDTDEEPIHLEGQVETIVLMTMLANFSLIGTVGNGLVIFVFQRVREKTTAQVFMIFLAIIDLFTCTVIIPLTMFMEYTRFQIEYNSLCKIYNFLITSKIPLSAFIMVAIAVDRFFCICHPLKKAITIPRARIVIVVFILTAFVFGVITSFFHGVVATMDRVDQFRIFQIVGHENMMKFLNISDSKQLMDEMMAKVAEEVLKRNLSVDWDVNSSLPRKKELINGGFCDITYLHMSHDTLHKYRTTYNAIYPTCLVIVIALYFMIYRFMCLRRSRKLRQRLKMCSYVNQNGGASNGTNGLMARDLEQGLVTELSAISQSPPGNNGKVMDNYNKNNAEDESVTRLLKETCLNESPSCRQYLSPPLSRHIKTGQSNSCSTLNTFNHSDARSVTEMTMSPATSCSQIVGTETPTGDITNCGSPSSASSGMVNNTDGERKNGHNIYSRPHHQQHNNKLRWCKKQESIKRYKNKKRALLKEKQRTSSHSRDYDPDRLREENRRANVRTALMLFTVNIVFVVAFGPAWLITLNVIPHYRLVFYLYFIYNAANPFIYAFMNHIFKSYMRNIFTCKRRGIMGSSS